MNLLNIEDNTFFDKDDKIKNLEKVERKLLSLLDEFADKESVPIEIKEEIRKRIIHLMTERKAKIWILNKSIEFTNRMNHTFSALMNNSADESPYTGRDIVYVNNVKHSKIKNLITYGE